MSLPTRVLIALVVGVAAGVAIASSGSAPLARGAMALEPLGTLWINAIRMTVIPLVVGSLIVGITSAPTARNRTAKDFRTDHLHNVDACDCEAVGLCELRRRLLSAVPWDERLVQPLG